jgi:cytidylate kinase
VSEGVGAGTGGGWAPGTVGRVPARRPVIAIDGPAGAGKSTLARRVAERADLLYVDTGAMYRAVAFAALEAGYRDPAGDAEAIVALAHRLRIDLEPAVGGVRVRLDGRDVTDRLRDPEVERLVPHVARLPGVREALLPEQRRLAAAGGVVLDGRDIGTVVLPDADWKFFVTASFAVRVERRYRQLRRKGIAVDRDTVARDLRERDRLDAAREVGPAPDAVFLDTTHMPVEQAVALVLRRCGLLPPPASGTLGDAEGPCDGRHPQRL